MKRAWAMLDGLADRLGILATAAAWCAKVARGQAGLVRRYPLTVGSLYVAVLCLISTLLIDRPLALFLKAHVHGNVEGFFKTVTMLGQAELYMVPAALMWLYLMVRSKRAALVHEALAWRQRSWRPAFLFISMAASGILEHILKIGFGRARPRLLFDGGIYGFHPWSFDWSLNSFPSGHSQAIWAAMTVALLLLPRYDLLWIGIAVLVAISRVVITVHFLGDAMAGSWLGFAVTILVWRLMKAKGVKL